MVAQPDSPHPEQLGHWTLRDIVLFAALPLVLSALAVGVTLALPGSPDTSPRKLFSNCLINGIAAFALAGVIQMWFTMGETRRADWERARADKATERADQATARADKATERADEATERADQATARADQAIARADNAERNLAELRLQLANLTDTVEMLRQQLAERSNGHPQS